MKTKKVKKVITALKYWIGHPLKRHLREIPTRVNNVKRRYFQVMRLCFMMSMAVFILSTKHKHFHFLYYSIIRTTLPLLLFRAN